MPKPTSAQFNLPKYCRSPENPSDSSSRQRRCLALGLKALNAGGRLLDAEKQNGVPLCYTPWEVSGGRAVMLRFPHKIDPGVCALDLDPDKCKYDEYIFK